MRIAYLSLGSNLGNREENLAHAIALLKSPEVRVLRQASVIETEPVGYLDQPRFLNTVVELETSLFPKQLLKHCQRIEKALGRVRTFPNAPRTLDIDIILFGRLVLTLPELQIPHPRFRERSFVLEPLVELAPELHDPVSGKTIRQLLSYFSQGK